MKCRNLPCAAMLAVTFLYSGSAMAQSNQCHVERKVPSPLLDEPTYRRLSDVYEYVGNEEYDAAYEDLVFLRKRAKGKYVKAIVQQAMAQVEWARGNFNQALSHFETAVELDVLPDQAHFALMYQIAQLYYMNERYDDALTRLELWMCKVPVEKIVASVYVLKASIYAQKEDWPNVISAISAAIDMAEKPKEAWYQLKLAAHFELEQFPEAAETLEILISNWPDKKDYWKQLSSVYLKLENDDKALSVMALAYRTGLLDKQADLLYLSNIYSFREVPFKAANVLQTGMEAGIVEPSEKHWTMAAEGWYASEELEKALYAYERAGKAALGGDIDLRRGYILVDLERWEEANEALEIAIEKGGFSETKMGEAYLMKGMSEFNLGNYNQASTNWGRASRYPRAKDAAQQWMNHLREERARKAP